MIAGRHRGPVPRLSLLGRLALALGIALALVGVALFVAIDRFVSEQFAQLREAEGARVAKEVRQTALAELRRLSGLAALLARDADLNHSTYYHLFLAGEREHPQAAVARIASAFDLESVTLWNTAGMMVAAQPGLAMAIEPPRAGHSVDSRFVRAADGSAWLVADAALMREGAPIAVLRLARPLERSLAGGLPALHPTALRLAAGPSTQGATRILLDEAGTVALDLSLPDTVGRALAKVKYLLAFALLGAGVLLAACLGLYLRWQLKPLKALAAAAAAVGRGDFTQQVRGGAAAEVAQLAAAFNAMTTDLSRLRDLERRLAHQEQLTAIGRVAARVAHDISNPLTVIGNAARLALKQLPRDHALVRDMQRIVHHSERCMRTVENLLDYGRPIRLQPSRLDLFAIAKDLAARWGAAPQGAGEAWIDGDRLQLEVMLENLLANARDAAGPHGRVSVAARTDTDSAIVEVIDDGPGFSESARAHLFEPFFTDKPGGTGLGLASALAIARAHGGDLEVIPGAHGRVRVRLPLARSAAPDRAAAAVAGLGG